MNSRNICEIPVYILVENYNREFLFKVKLAENIIHQNITNRIIIGDQRNLFFLLRWGMLEPGIVFVKSAQNYILNILKAIKKHGHKIILQDEEGLVLLKDSDGKFENRNSDNCLDYISKIFCWTEDEYNSYLERNIRLKNKLILSGNLRTNSRYIGLNSVVYNEEIQTIRSEKDDFILIVGNAKIAYSKFGETPIKDVITNNVLKKNKSSKNYLDSILQWSLNMRLSYFSIFEFISLVSNDPSFENVEIVYRPHPGEDVDFIRHILQDIPKTSVDTRYSIKPWLITAKAVIGSGCTVLVESLINEKPTYSIVNYRHLPKNSFISTMKPNDLAIGCSFGHELHERVLRDKNLNWSSKEVIKKSKEAKIFANSNIDTSEVISKEIECTLGQIKRTKSFKVMFFKTTIAQNIIIKNVVRILTYSRKFRYSKAVVNSDNLKFSVSEVKTKYLNNRKMAKNKNLIYNLIFENVLEITGKK